MKKTIQITESELKHLIKNSITESIGEYKSIKRDDKDAIDNSYIIVPEPGDYDYSNHDDCPFDIIKSENEPDELNYKTNEMNESRGLGYGLGDDEKRKVRDEHSDMRKHSHHTGRGVKQKPGEKAKKTYDIFKREGNRGNPWSKTLKKGGAADWVANMQDDDANESVGRKTIRLTENDIRRMVMEAMDELDWKTAVNAANISRNSTKSRLANTALRDKFHNPYYANKLISNDDRGIKKDGDDYDKETIRRMKQSDNLSRFADKAIRDKFGFQSYYDDLNGFGMEQPVLRDYLDPDTDTGLETYSPKWDDKRVYYKDGDVTHLSNMPQDFQDKANEINDFVKGKYRYEKGKGWTKDELEEAITRAIRKYLR